MLFRRATLCFSALTLIALCLSFVAHIQLRPSDIPLYRRLVRESAELRSRRALEKHPAHQIREKVQKDIWTVDGSKRLHSRLNSKYSELTLKQKKDKIEAIEDLQEINCWIQEEIDQETQTQKIRTITAAEGIYHYPSHHFLGESVHLAFYRVPGFELPDSFSEKPFLTGVAQKATFTAASKTPKFTAYQVTAQLDLEGAAR